jgi:hypothetical protein
VCTPDLKADIREDFGMVARATVTRSPNISSNNEVHANMALPEISFSVGVRTKFGEELEGIDLLSDGMVFRSPAQIQPGRLLELIVCRGSILVDAIVVQSTPLRDGSGAYAIHTRYQHVSDALNSLIREEVARQSSRPDLLDV